MSQSRFVLLVLGAAMLMSGCGGPVVSLGNDLKCKSGDDTSCGQVSGQAFGHCNADGSCTCSAGTTLDTATNRCVLNCTAPTCSARSCFKLTVDFATCQCVYDALPAGTACDDGDATTFGDVCDGLGKCAGKKACTAGQDQTCNADRSVSALWGHCNADGTCSCGSSFMLNVNGQCRPQTCPSDCILPRGIFSCYYSALDPQTCECIGKRLDEGTACGEFEAPLAGTCDAGGHCVLPFGCIPLGDQSCNSDRSDSTAWGRCDDKGACTCYSGYKLDAATGRCVPVSCAGCPAPSSCHSVSQDPATCACTYPTLALGSACSGGHCDGKGACVPSAGCLFGQDQSCNSDPISEAVWGHCNADGTCTCKDGYYLSKDTGLCLRYCPSNCANPPACYENNGTADPITCMCTYPASPAGTACDDGNPLTTGEACDGKGACVAPKGCTPSEDQTCNSDPAVSTLWGHCNADGTCTCTTGFVLDPDTGRCRPVSCPTDCTTAPGPCYSYDGTLDPVTCKCTYPAMAVGTYCDDGNPNTAWDACDGKGNCVPTTGCTPGMDQTCNGSDQISSLWGHCNADGTCSCNGNFYVDPVSGRCLPNCPSNCAQTSNACLSSNGTADPVTCECHYDFLPAGTMCDDGNPATLNDHCDGQGHCGAICTYGKDETCADHSWEVGGGTCNADGTCTCGVEYFLDPATAKCRWGKCDMIGQDCPDPLQACFTPDGSNLYPFCAIPGSKADGDMCSASTDCRRGSTCMPGMGCYKMCDFQAKQPDCPAGETCQPYWQRMGMPGLCTK